jgi:hypothetical protein
VEARILLAGLPENATNVVKSFIDNFDGERGTATIKQLLTATGHSKAENVGKLVAWLQLRVRAATGDPDAWLVNWRAEDWIWDEQENHYTDGIYYIDSDAALAIKEALEDC